MPSRVQDLGRGVPKPHLPDFNPDRGVGRARSGTVGSFGAMWRMGVVPGSLPAQPLNVASASCASFLARQISGPQSIGQHLDHHHQHQHLASTSMEERFEDAVYDNGFGFAFLVDRQPFAFADSKL